MHEFEKHAARAFFASAWADAAEDAENGPSLSGCEIMEVMPVDIDPAAIHAARTLRMGIERANGASVDTIFGAIQCIAEGDRPITMEFFGHYAAMQAMGHGVGLNDAFGSEVYRTIKVPYCEFGQHSLERDYF